MLKCIKCTKENIYSANYCSDCGYHFEEIEQKTAKKQTFIGKIEWWEDFYNKWTLKKLLEKKWIKILSFFLLIAIDVLIFYNANNDFKLLESDAYQIEYDKKEDIYYLLITEDRTNIELYAPKRLTKIEIKKENKDNEVIDSLEYNPSEKLVLDANSKNDYYIFDINYKGNKTEQIKVYVFKVM